MKVQPAFHLIAASLKRFPAILGLVLFWGAHSLCAQDTTAPKLRIVTSFLPIQSHVAAVAGEHATVEQLLGRDAGPHDFQLSPSAVRRLADADIFIINGAGMEDWLGEIVKASGNPALIVVDTSVGINLLEDPVKLEIEAVAHDKPEPHGHDHDDHAHPGGMNPHIWLDPVIAQQQVATILLALQKADPHRGAVFEANAQAYIKQLIALDAEFRERLEPLSNKNLVTFHEAFPYLAARYGLNYVGAIAEFPERDPTPQQLAALVDEIKRLRVGVLFSEQGYAPSLLRRIAAQTGARVSQLDTLEVGQGSAEAYLLRMRANLDALTIAFSEEPAP